MTKPPRPEEMFAFEVLRRVLGATFEAFDDNSAPRQTDGLFVLSDGTRGAVEVTTIADRDALEFDGLTRGPWKVDGSEWRWTVRAPPGLRLSDLRPCVANAVTACEAAGVRTLDDYPHGRDPYVAKLRSFGVHMDGFPSKLPRCVFVVSEPYASGVDATMNAL